MGTQLALPKAKASVSVLTPLLVGLMPTSEGFCAPKLLHPFFLTLIYGQVSIQVFLGVVAAQLQSHPLCVSCRIL